MRRSLRHGSPGELDTTTHLDANYDACKPQPGDALYLTPVFQSVEMAALIPSARLQVLPRGGHGMAVEYASDTVAAIRAFLDAA